MDYNKTILIVDDTKVNILKAEYILKEYGFRTHPALSGEEAIKKLLTHKIDLILLDIEMPEMDGFATLKAIRAIERLAVIPVIFVTGDKEYDIILKALDQKVAGYITKPFDEDELIKHVKKALFPSAPLEPEEVLDLNNLGENGIPDLSEIPGLADIPSLSDYPDLMADTPDNADK